MRRVSRRNSRAAYSYQLAMRGEDPEANGEPRLVSWGITSSIQIVKCSVQQTASIELPKIIVQEARSRKQTARSEQPVNDSEQKKEISE